MANLLWGYLLAALAAVSAHREHKVHNIVLYPEKHSWCKTTPIKQVVGHPGCAQTEVDNNVCVGACFSYSIPRTEPTAPGEVLPYCDSCQPRSVSWKHVKLSCENEVELTKKVEVIEDCSCLSCPAPPEKVGEEGAAVSPADVPQLLGLLSLHRSNTTTHGKLKHSERLSLLLKMLSEEGEGVGEVQDLISQISGDDEVLNSNQQGDGDDEQVKVDLGKLRAFLSRMDTGHHHHRHHQLHHSEKEEAETPTTLDVPSHQLRPALEGEEITYIADHKTESETNTQTPEQT
ncbi:uncharacterized protein [Halyomorpha halys]|uniref:uncharacterized protein n=1 Tax=Halyomorpha halys TaxID=286706 RepID=UPI0006D4DC82|nr:uncharacterized protein LOC106677403 [Halyomorpha halys]XP_014270812.1 uncharacterized protein LOC106677403 [Halyomorpha halys]XP_014270813.1 uncharacterized protein LOC106677403 [Halyomorpha halys]